MSTSDNQSTSRPATQARPTLIGSYIRVLARRGYLVEGLCLDAWHLCNGGVALKLKPSDGSALREVTTLAPVIVLSGPVRRSS